MANNASALKRNRQNEKKRIFNRTFRNRARTLVKKARAAINASKPDLSAAEQATLIALRDLDMAASKGVIHKRNAARRKSRLMAQLNALRAKQK
jgi:small subunit ribosomal protein S20